MHDAMTTSILEQLNKPFAFSEIRSQLMQYGVSKDSMETLEKYNFESRSFEHGLSQLQSLLGPSKLKDELEQLSQLVRFLTSFGVRSRILLVPLLSYNAGYYRGGMMFQIVYANKKKLGKFFIRL